MIKYFSSIFQLATIVLLTSVCGYAQFYNNGSQVTVTNGAQLYIKTGDLINKDSSIYNAGTITVDGNCIIHNKSTSRIITFGSDSLIVTGNFSDSSVFGQNTGILSLNGANQSIQSKSNLLANLAISGTGLKTIQGTVYVRFKLDLQKGHVLVPSTSFFGIDSTGSISQTGTGSNSFVIGKLFRKKNNGIDSLYFPIGNTINEYRPSALVGIAAPTAKYPVFGIETQISAPQAGMEVSTIYNRTWKVTSSIPNYTVNNIRLYYQAAEVASMPAQSLVIAQSLTETGKYNSIGSISSKAGTLLSEFKPSQTFYAIGSTNNVKGNFRVFLEGPFNGVGMDAGLLTNNALSDSLLPSIGMLPGYSIPVDAVDRIAFILKTTTTAIDTSYAWLLKDGSVKDYLTGTRDYVTFSKAVPGNSYFVIAHHRNHLPASSASVALTSTSTKSVYNYDYTNGVYGGGAMFDLSANKWKLYAGDAYKSSKDQVDVMDVVSIGKDVNSLLVTGSNHYRTTDVNLDGSINSQDYQLSTDHNNKLYYSTLP